MSNETKPVWTDFGTETENSQTMGLKAIRSSFGAGSVPVLFASPVLMLNPIQI